MYSYHNTIKKRINNGELIGIEKAKDSSFAFVFIFKTKPHFKPIRPHAVYRYLNILEKYNFKP